MLETAYRIIYMLLVLWCDILARRSGTNLIEFLDPTFFSRSPAGMVAIVLIKLLGFHLTSVVLAVWCDMIADAAGLIF